MYSCAESGTCYGGLNSDIGTWYGRMGQFFVCSFEIMI